MQILSIGDLSFTLPDNLNQLQEHLGGEGACVNAGYSLIGEEDQGWDLMKEMHQIVNDFLTLFFL